MSNVALLSNIYPDNENNKVIFYACYPQLIRSGLAADTNEIKQGKQLLSWILFLWAEDLHPLNYLPKMFSTIKTINAFVLVKLKQTLLTSNCNWLSSRHTESRYRHLSLCCLISSLKVTRNFSNLLHFAPRPPVIFLILFCCRISK